MHILYIHSTIWCDFYSRLLHAFQSQHAASVSIICDEDNTSVYQRNFQLGAKHIPYPDLRTAWPFEADPVEFAALRGRLARCEAKVGKTLRRSTLSSERNFGRSYSRGFFYWPENPLNRYCRKDPARQDLILFRGYRFIEELFEREKPSLVLCQRSNGAMALMAWFQARFTGSPFLMSRFSKILSGHTFWTDDYSMYNTAAIERAREMIACGDTPSAAGLAKVREFADKPDTVDYIKNNWSVASSRTFFIRHWNMLMLLKNRIKYVLRGEGGKAPAYFLEKLYEYYRILIMKKLHAKHFRTFTEEELGSFHYVYYPLHKEPELMLNFSAPLWHDQGHAVKYLSSMLPAGCKLLAREHRFNWGRRYGAYLKRLASLPGVVLVDPFDSQFKYIRNAALVITDNGSTGWEALLLGRKVVTLEKTFYDGANLARQVEDPRLMDAFLLRAFHEDSPSPEERETRLALAVDAEFEHSMRLETMLADPELSMRWILQRLAHQLRETGPPPRTSG